MTCDWVCKVQRALDLWMVVSVAFYSLILFAVLKRRPFSYSFTAVTVSLGIADVVYSVVLRFTSVRYNVFADYEWYRCVSLSSSSS